MKGIKPAGLAANTTRDAEIAEKIGVAEVCGGLADTRTGQDADYDRVIAASVAAHADLIVSGDRKHLLPLGSHQGIEIVEAAQALRRIASG